MLFCQLAEKLMLGIFEDVRFFYKQDLPETFNVDRNSINVV
jgi:hypothetical protein